MKILLLHPQDIIPAKPTQWQWDLIVDLGHAPISTYALWSARAGCPVISIYDFAEEAVDLRRAKTLVEIGTGLLIDRYKIDWWEVLAVEVLPELQQLMLVRRLANHINHEVQVYSTRSDYRSAALHALLGGHLVNLENSLQATVRRLHHYRRVVSDFSASQIGQIIHDKFDREHAIRRRFGTRRPGLRQPLILFPSAYSTVSQMAVSYAASLPGEACLLACIRANAKVKNLPPNIQMISMDPYFASLDKLEISKLFKGWSTLKVHLSAAAPEYRCASRGVFDRFPSLLRWGVLVRDAWNRLFEQEHIRACFCGDHSNPYTRIPLLLAQQAGIQTFASHHGALDSGMAMTSHDADFYVAKSELERDYMIRVCEVPRQKVVSLTLRNSIKSPPKSLPHNRSAPWLVFFSEPYNILSWRVDEVYRVLLPRLCALAENCALKIVFKLHPFENVATHRKLLLRHLSAEKARSIDLLDGPISNELWQNARLALTAQSSVALECNARGVPIFLCGWLRDPFSGYIQQYHKFGVGRLLETVDQISQIPEFLACDSILNRRHDYSSDTTNPVTLKQLLVPVHVLQDAVG